MTRIARVVDCGSADRHPQVLNDDMPSAKSASARRFWRVRERAYQVSNPKNLRISTNDFVELYLPPGQTILSAAMIFLLPPAMFLAGYSLSGRFLFHAVGAAGNSAFTRDELAFFVGFTFFLVTFPLMTLFRIRGAAARVLPEIIRRLTPSEVKTCRAKEAEGCGSCTACR